MADSDSPRPAPHRRTARAMPLPDCVALVLQGGGALGSYQAGVLEELAQADVAIDWVAGISIGAVNAALIAGNPPERRVDALREFWNRVTSGLPFFPLYPDANLRETVNEWSAGLVMTGGVPGFFRPRALPPMFAPPGTAEALSFYDTSELHATLNELVDWELLNTGPVRLSVGAVNIENGNFRYFDTRTDRIDARHIMASGALPPGLPPVEIEGAWWWDGGLVSNTPLTHVLDHQTGPMLVFQVDLFSAHSALPRTIMDVIAREKEIRFSSRTRQISDEMLALRKVREQVVALLDKLPDDMRNDPDVVALRERATEQPVSLVHLIYRANAWEGGVRDFEFSARTMHEHWEAGRTAVAETMANATIVAANLADGHSAAFDLTRR